MQSKSCSNLKLWGMAAIFAFLVALLAGPGWAGAGSGHGSPAAQVAAAVSPRGLVPAVVYYDNGYHIHEIALKGTWLDRDLTAAATGAPTVIAGGAKIMAFRRRDGVSMVVYRGTDTHIHALYLELVFDGKTWKEVWRWADLTAITGSPHASSDPFGSVRSDGVSTVVYAGIDGNLHELRLDNGWRWADLTAISGAPAASTSRPVAYVRADGIDTIVYKEFATSHIIELRLDSGWKWADLTDLAKAPLPASDLSAYVRSDGISTILYTAADKHVHEVRLEEKWIWADLSVICGAPDASLDTPYGYVRSDKINAILYAAYAGYVRVHELRLDNGWKHYELTSIKDAQGGYGPVGYVRSDGITAVVYVGWITRHIYEIRLEVVWIWADLTAIAGGPDVRSIGWAYNRSTVTYTFMPVMRRR